VATDLDLWARSGAMALTGTPTAPPLLAGAGAARIVAAALDAIVRRRPTARLPGVELLGERAAVAGLTRNAPWTVGGAGRAVRAADGWWFLSLARESDVAAIPALIEAEVSDCWHDLDMWSLHRTRREVVDRAQLLSLPAAMIPADGDQPDEQNAHRGGVPIVRVPGGSRPRHDAAPLVLDFSSLWAGPLCASLLGACGSQVVKVESSTRLDGARNGPGDFYDLLHGGHDAVTIDFHTSTGRAQVQDLVRRADVVIEASRPRAMASLGIDPMDAVSSGTIWVSVTAYGRTGPWANRVGFGDDVAAAAGLVGWIDGVPVPVGDAIADPLAGVTAAAAAIEAVDAGRGALLDVSMRDVAMQAAALSLTAGCSPYPVAAAPPVARRVQQPAKLPGEDNDTYLSMVHIP